MQNKILNNVKYIINQYEDYIKNDKQLVLLYWQKIDGVEMDKKSISTTDFLNKATKESDILSARLMLEVKGEI